MEICFLSMPRQMPQTITNVPRCLLQILTLPKFWYHLAHSFSRKLALAKVCSVLGNIHDVSWHLSKHESELKKRWWAFSFSDKNCVHKNEACASNTQCQIIIWRMLKEFMCTEHTSSWVMIKIYHHLIIECSLYSLKRVFLQNLTITKFQFWDGPKPSNAWRWKKCGHA